MTEAINMKMDSYTDLQMITDKKGQQIPAVYQAFFFGKSDNPIVEFETPLEHIIDKYIEMNVIPGNTVTETYRHDILKTLETIQKLVNKKIVYINNLPTPEEKENRQAKKEKLSEKYYDTVLKKATDVLGNKKSAKKWINSEALALDLKKPADLIKNKKGFTLVMETLTRMDYNVYQ